MFAQGLVIFTIGPIVGWVRDVTQSYVLTFNLLTLAMAACAVPWLIEMLIVNKRKMRVQLKSVDNFEQNELECL